MFQYPLPQWWDFTVSGATLPDFYWNVKSQEERIKKICEDLWKLIQAYKMLVDAINDHEGRISTLEKKVKVLEEQVEDLYTKYNALLKTIETLNNRVGAVEERMTNVEQRMTNLESRLTDVINGLPKQIRDIVNQVIDSQEFRDKLRQIVNDLISGLLVNKMDKVTGAVENNFATYGVGGQVKDSGKKQSDFLGKIDGPADNIITTTGDGQAKSSGKKLTDYQAKVRPAVENNIATFNNDGQVKDSGKSVTVGRVTSTSNDNQVPTAKAVYDSMLIKVTDPDVNNLPKEFGTYYLNTAAGNVSWVVTVNGIEYSTNTIRIEGAIKNQNIIVESGWFKNPTNPTPVMIERYFNVTTQTWSNWTIVTHEYIESTEAKAKETSKANPNALVYVPEEE